MQHSDFEIPTERTGTGAAPALSHGAIASRAAAALEHGDHEAAGNLLRNWEDRFPDDPHLRRLANKQRRQADRFTQVHSLLQEAHKAIADDRFVQALGAFREAANLSRGMALLEETFFNAAMQACESLGSRNWRVAGAVLEDAARLNSKLLVPPQLWQVVQAAERAENIANVLAETALAKPGELLQARERLLAMLERYPQDSGLTTRLRSIEATIDEKRKWDGRLTSLKKLTDLRDELQGVEDPAQAARFVRLSENLASPFVSVPEFSSVVEEIRQQAVSAEKATAALHEDRIDDCLEECASVLSRVRHHKLFLHLKEKAEERELALVDEYSKTAARVKDLVAAGQLAQAETLCGEAMARLPHLEQWQELSREIVRLQAERTKENQEKLDSAQRLVERAQASLRERQFRAAEQFFLNTLKLLPGDKVLNARIIAILHGFARTTAVENGALAAEVLELAERILPASAVPADLRELLEVRRKKAKAEALRWAALSRIEELRAQVKLVEKPEHLHALRTEIESSHFGLLESADVNEAAALLFRKIDAKLAAFDRKNSRWPVLRAAVSVAAVFLVVAGIYLWLRTRGASLVRPKPPGVQVVNLSKPAAEPSPAAPFASLEIHGGEPYTQIKLDGIVVAGVGKNQILTQKLPAGRHSIELSSNGYLPKMFTRRLAPGEKLVLTEQDLKLDSSDAKTVAAVKLGPNELAEKPSWAVVQGAVPKDAKGSVPSPAAKVERPQPPSPSVSKTSAPPRQAVLEKAPLPSALVKPPETTSASSSRVQDKGLRADVSAKPALEEFLKNHPARPYTNASSNAMSDLDREAQAVAVQSAEDEAWKNVSQRDAASLESYLRVYPAARNREEAEQALAAIKLNQTKKTETAAVLTVLSRFAHAWTKKDLDSILSIQKNLNRRAVKAELSQVKELDVQISPASAPQIDGSQAVVLCRRQALQVFSDGTRKQIPDVIVSYVLAKHDGAWTIQETR